MSYNNNNSNSNDNNQTNNKKKPVTPTLGEAVKEAIETGKEVVVEGPTDAGDLTGVNADSLFNTNEQERINKEIVNGIVVSLDDGDESKIAIDVKDTSEGTSSVEDKIIINPEISGEVKEATVATVTTIPAEGEIEVEVQTEVEVPVEDKDKEVESELKLKVKSPTLSTEVPITAEHTPHSPSSTTSDLEKRKTATSLDAHAIQQQLSNDGSYSEPMITDINKKTDKTMNEFSQYPITNDKSQKRTPKATINVVNDYIKFQNQAINSLLGAYIPILDTTNNMFLTNQTLYGRILEICSKSSTIYTENTIALGKMINEIAKANIFAYSNLFNIAK